MKNKKNIATSTIGDDNVTDPNQIIDETNSQPDYYTATMNEDLGPDEKRSTTATQGLEEVKSNGPDEINIDDLSLTPENELNEDGLNTTTETARFTDEGGTVKRNTTFSQSVSSGLDAGTPGHWGVDEDTD